MANHSVITCNEIYQMPGIFWYLEHRNRKRRARLSTTAVTSNRKNVNRTGKCQHHSCIHIDGAVCTGRRDALDVPPSSERWNTLTPRTRAHQPAKIMPQRLQASRNRKRTADGRASAERETGGGCASPLFLSRRCCP